MIDGFIFNKSVLIHVHTLQMKLSCMSKKRRCFGVVKDAFAKEVRGFQKGKVVQYGEPCENVIPRKVITPLRRCITSRSIHLWCKGNFSLTIVASFSTRTSL
jgi:hypothetical protein